MERVTERRKKLESWTLIYFKTKPKENSNNNKKEKARRRKQEGVSHRYRKSIMVDGGNKSVVAYLFTLRLDLVGLV